MFRTYDKIIRLGKEETDGILQGTVHVEEKVDGANLSVWLEEDGIHVGSRNNDLTKNGNEFNGAVEYCKNHEGISNLLRDYPTYRLYGEWLVKHTVEYKATAYRKFYLFDILDASAEIYMASPMVHELADRYGIEQVPLIATIESPTMEQLNELMGKSQFGDRGEGIVIKNPGFINQFGKHCYAKIVSESFKEDNGVVFGGNNKFSDSYWEMYVVNKYMTLARVEKIMHKLQPLVDVKLDLQHIPRISGIAYHDMITEEAWEIAQKAKKIDYDILKRIATKKAIQIYKDILNDSISVADLQ